MEPKSVLITGANRGLGLEFVKQFLKLEKPPVHVFAACRDPEKAEELQRIAKGSETVNIIKLEIKNLESAKSAADEVNKIVGTNGLNLLINNAGIAKSGSSSTATAEDLMENFRVNTVGPILVSQAFLPLLKIAAQGLNLKGQSCSKAAIINVSSKLGSIGAMTGHPTTFPYNLSKAALNMTTKMQSVELKDENILVMSVCPGWVQTDMGTANATLTPEQSIGALLKVLSEVDEKDTGTFRSQDGSVIEW